MSFYLLYKDGSFLPIKTLEDAKKLPKYKYIVSTHSYVERNGTFTDQYIEYKFINIDGNDEPLKIGDWELVFLSRELVSHRVKMVMSYRLFNNTTETVSEFERKTPGMDFFKNELFPKLFELNGISDYNYSLVLNKLEELKAAIVSLEKKIDN